MTPLQIFGRETRNLQDVVNEIPVHSIKWLPEVNLDCASWGHFLSLIVSNKFMSQQDIIKDTSPSYESSLVQAYEAWRAFFIRATIIFIIHLYSVF